MVKYLILNRNCSLKLLERPYVYNIESDELYEVDDKGFELLSRCDGTMAVNVRPDDTEFIDYCLEENILSVPSEPLTIKVKRPNISRSPIPSLRYLELQITNRCNLACRHCYLGKAGRLDMDKETLFGIFREFEEIHGLRLLLSGGEPLLHKEFWYINERLRDYAFRTILLTNGSLISRETARRLKVHEVQISLDGMEESHDLLRGEGSFKKVVSAIRHLQEAEIKVSVATMVHAKNTSDFNALEELVKNFCIEEWNVDVPCVEGYLTDNKEFILPPSEAGRFLQYGFGGGSHGSSNGYVCGSHLCAVMPEGKVARCGFFTNEPLGTIEEGLETCWRKLKHQRINELFCDCPYVEECKGGCRYRAISYYGDIRSPDPVQCYARGLRKEVYSI